MSLQISAAPEETRELYKLALLAREKAYSPYSGFKVGAALRTSSGKIYTGCNVENSSYGATVCAERVAIQKAISELGQLTIAEMMVVSTGDPPWPPCGMCRQVMVEFGTNATVYCSNVNGTYFATTLDTLYPQSFKASHLQGSKP